MPESRQSDVMRMLGKCGAPGAIRTPDLQIRSLWSYQENTYKFQYLELKYALGSFEEFCGFWGFCQKVCQNLAIVHSPGKPPSHRWNRLEVLPISAFIRSVLLNALKALTRPLTRPIQLLPGWPVHKMVRFTCLYPKPAAAIGWIGVDPALSGFEHRPYGTGNAGRHIKEASPETYSVNRRALFLSARCLGQYESRPCSAWSRPSAQEDRQ